MCWSFMLGLQSSHCIQTPWLEFPCSWLLLRSFGEWKEASPLEWKFPSCKELNHCWKPLKGAKGSYLSVLMGFISSYDALGTHMYPPAESVCFAIFNNAFLSCCVLLHVVTWYWCYLRGVRIARRASEGPERIHMEGEGELLKSQILDSLRIFFFFAEVGGRRWNEREIINYMCPTLWNLLLFLAFPMRLEITSFFFLHICITQSCLLLAICRKREPVDFR